MGQKANPISLRLQIHREHDNAWYAEKSRFGICNTREIQIRTYLKSLFNSLDLSCGRIIFQIYPKKILVHSFFLENQNSQGFQIRNRNQERKFQGNDKNQRLGNKIISNQNLRPRLLSLFCLAGLHAIQYNQDINLLAYCLLSKSSTNLNIHYIDNKVEIYPMKVNSKYSSAYFVSHWIAECLSRNLSFREIFRNLQKEMVTSVLGLRIMCSGRLGGVEMAKVESRKFGQTSLHTFSGKVDYACTEAYTLYGIIGVRVWLLSNE